MDWKALKNLLNTTEGKAVRGATAGWLTKEGLDTIKNHNYQSNQQPKIVDRSTVPLYYPNGLFAGYGRREVIEYGDGRTQVKVTRPDGTWYQER